MPRIKGKSYISLLYFPYIFPAPHAGNRVYFENLKHNNAHKL